MRGERRRQGQVRFDDAEEVLVDSGLVDVDYVAAQLGTSFDTAQEAARAAVQAGDVSPHPLFEAQWVGRRRSWQRLGQHPDALPEHVDVTTVGRLAQGLEQRPNHFVNRQKRLRLPPVERINLSNTRVG